MVDVKAREIQLKERLAELEGRLHRIEDHLGQSPDQDWEDNAIESEMDQVLEGLGFTRSSSERGGFRLIRRARHP